MRGRGGQPAPELAGGQIHPDQAGLVCFLFTGTPRVKRSGDTHTESPKGESRGWEPDRAARQRGKTTSGGSKKGES